MARVTLFAAALLATPLLLLYLLAPSPALCDEGDDAFQQALALFNQARYDDAFLAFEEVRANYPDFAPEAQRYKGYSRLRQGRPDDALTEYARVLGDYPDSPSAHEIRFWIGYSYLVKGQPDKAEASFQEQIVEYPENHITGRAMLKVGEILVDRYDYTGALELYGKVIKEHPPHAAEAHFLTGVCYQIQSNFGKAKPEFEEVTSKFPDSDRLVEAEFRLGECYRALKQYIQELAHFERLANTYKDDDRIVAQCLTRQSEVLSLTGKHDEAIAKCEEVASRFPGNPLAVDAAYRIARIHLYGRQDFLKARSLLADFTRDYPGFPNLIQARYDLAYSYFVLGDADESIRRCAQIIADHPNSGFAPYLQYFIGSAHLHVGRVSEARNAFQTTIDNYPGDPWAEVAQRMLDMLDW